MRFKDFLTEAKKGVTRDEAKDLFKRIKSSLRPEMSDPSISQNGPWWDLMIRDYEYFTPRPGEEDDDHPDFTGEKNLLKKLKPILKGIDWQFSPEEKSWISISLKAKKLTKKQMAIDKKKKASDVFNAVKAESRSAPDRFWQKFYQNMIPELTKFKKKFITKDEFYKLAEGTKWYDFDATEEVWSMA